MASQQEAEVGNSKQKHMAQGDVVIDELLCFVTNKLDVLPSDTIIQLCKNSFDDDEIEASKKLLFDLCANENTTRFKKRIGVDKGKHNMEDLIKLLQEKGDEVPKFVALNLSKLPPITFDSVDVSVLLTEIRKTQNEVKYLKETVETQNHVAREIKESSAMMNTRINRLERKCDDPLSDTSVKSAMYEPGSTSVKSVMYDPASGEIGDGSLGLRSEAGPRSYAAMAKTIVKPQHLQVNTVLRPPRPVNMSGKTNRGVIGTGCSDSRINIVKTRMKTANMFATRFEPSVSPQDLQSYLESKLNVKVDVEEVPTKYDTYASFHVVSKCEDPSVFLNPELWPEDCYVRWWRQPRNRQVPQGQVPLARLNMNTGGNAEFNQRGDVNESKND